MLGRHGWEIVMGSLGAVVPLRSRAGPTLSAQVNGGGYGSFTKSKFFINIRNAFVDV